MTTPDVAAKWLRWAGGRYRFAVGNCRTGEADAPYGHPKIAPIGQMAIFQHEIVSAIIRILIASEAVALRHLSSASAIALIPDRIVLIAVLRGTIARALTLIATAPRVIAVAFGFIAIALRAGEIANGATAFSTCEKMSAFTLSPQILSQLESLGDRNRQNH